MSAHGNKLYYRSMKDMTMGTVYYKSKSKGISIDVDDMSERWVRNAFKKFLREGVQNKQPHLPATDDVRIALENISRAYNTLSRAVVA